MGGQPVARAHTTLLGLLCCATRVAKPALGERRRTLASLLALVLPAYARDIAGQVGRGVARELPSRAPPRTPLVHPRRGRRDELRAARDPSLRPRAAASLGRARREVPPPPLEPPLPTPP